MIEQDLVDDLIADYLDRRARGESPAPEEYYRKHPALRGALAERFDTIRLLDQLQAADSANQVAGERIGRYRVLRVIGRGGMGIVFLAEEPESGRQVALKVLHSPLTCTQSTRNRFRSEAEVARRLRHPNLVAVYETGEHRGCPYFAMQLVDGVTLAEVIHHMREAVRSGRPLPDLATAVGELLPERDGEGTAAAVEGVLSLPQRGPYTLIARLVAEIADGLAHAHARGVIHRDVKPQNILLDHTLTPYLADFGLAKQVDKRGETGSGDMIGTPHYMSPEVAVAHGRKIDHRTDVYSLGVTMFELLTLGVPFPGNSTHEVVSRILTQEPPRPRRLNPAVPPDMQTIVLRAMEKDPRDRFESASDMAEDLRRVLRHEPILSRPPGIARVARRTLARHRGIFLGAAAVALACTVWMVGGQVAEARQSANWLKLAEDRYAAADFVGALVAAEKGLEHVSSPALLEARDRAAGVFPVQFHSAPAGASVVIRPIDPMTGKWGPRTAAGRTDLTGALSMRLAVGTYVAVVDKEGLGFGEFLVDVAREQTERSWSLPVKPTAECTAGMARIEGGRYRIGRPDGDTMKGRYMLVESEIEVKPFLIDKHEVSRGDYAAYAKEVGLASPWVEEDLAGDGAMLPATGINAEAARRYAESKGKRLPTEAEWEVAARGRAARPFSWGADFDARRGIFGSEMTSDKIVVNPRRGPVRVDAATDDVTPEGVMHLMGNVREWTMSLFVLPDTTDKGEQWLIPQPFYVAVKGASYLRPAGKSAVAAWNRAPYRRLDRDMDVGFRCAKSVSP